MAPRSPTLMSSYHQTLDQVERKVQKCPVFDQDSRTKAESISAAKLTLGNEEQLLPPQWKNAENSEAERCAWLRSQIIGRNVEFTTPLGVKRVLTYADHTASGQHLLHVENILAQRVLPFYGNTHTEDSHVGKRMSQAVQEAGDFIKHCLGGTEEEAIFFCGAGTTAALKKLQDCMAITVPSTLRERVLRMLDPDERWVVFIGPYEHHSNLLSWRESLAEVIEIPINEDGSGVDMRELKVRLQDPKYRDRPKLGSFSAASNVTGIMSDTRAIARLLHEHGAFACFDFAACGPYVKIDMRAGELDGYDALVLSPHKFVGGPGSPGILLMSRKLYLLKDGPPSFCGGGTVEFVNGYSRQDTLYIENVEHREDAGTPPIVQKVRAALAFWVKELIGYHLIETREQHFITTAIKRLQKSPYIRILGNTEAKRCAILSFIIDSKEPMKNRDTHQLQLVPQIHRRKVSSLGEEYASCCVPDEIDISAFNFDMEKEKLSTEQRGKPLHCRFVVRLLNDLFGIQARAGCACAGPYGHYLLNINHQRSLAIRESLQQGKGAVRPGWARLSFCYYISNEEFEFVLSAIEFLAEYGQRFLPLYNFNWYTGEWTCKNTLDSGIPQATITSRFSRKDDSYLSMTNELEGISTSQQYCMYLDSAKTIAKLLDAHPKHVDVPLYINSALIDFRV